MNKLNQIFRANVTNRQSWVKNQLKKILPGAKILDVDFRRQTNAAKLEDDFCHT